MKRFVRSVIAVFIGFVSVVAVLRDGGGGGRMGDQTYLTHMKVTSRMTRHRADTPHPIMLKISRAKTSMSPDTSYQIYNSEHNEWLYRMLIFLFTTVYSMKMISKQQKK